jgi:hypothetical protein
VSRIQAQRWNTITYLADILSSATSADLVDLDALSTTVKSAVLCSVINEIPSMCARLARLYPETLMDAHSLDLKEWLEGAGMTESEIAVGKVRKLGEIHEGTIPSVVWKVLRWYARSA